MVFEPYLVLNEGGKECGSRNAEGGIKKGGSTRDGEMGKGGCGEFGRRNSEGGIKKEREHRRWGDREMELGMRPPARRGHWTYAPEGRRNKKGKGVPEREMGGCGEWGIPLRFASYAG